MCALYGLPGGLSWGGTLEGEWNSETQCLVYEEAGSLEFFPFELSALTNGTLCPVAPGGPVSLE
jgi:hypothetical protein